MALPVGGRRLHGLLRIDLPRDQRRHDAAARRAAAARTTIRADRLSRARVVDRRRAGRRFARPCGQSEPEGRTRPIVRPVAAARLRAGGRALRRGRQRARRAGADAEAERTCFGAVPAERLVGARHPGVGVSAARPVPRQELRDHRSRRGWSPSRRSSRSRAGVHPARRATRSRCRIWTRRDRDQRRPSTSRSRCRSDGADARRGLPPFVCRATTCGISTGRPRSC